MINTNLDWLSEWKFFVLRRSAVIIVIKRSSGVLSFNLTRRKCRCTSDYGIYILAKEEFTDVRGNLISYALTFFAKKIPTYIFSLFIKEKSRVLETGNTYFSNLQGWGVAHLSFDWLIGCMMYIYDEWCASFLSLL